MTAEDPGLPDFDLDACVSIEVSDHAFLSYLSTANLSGSSQRKEWQRNSVFVLLAEWWPLYFW